MPILAAKKRIRPSIRDIYPPMYAIISTKKGNLPKEATFILFSALI